MNILLADDESMSRLTLKRLLSRFPEAAVIEAEDGEQAWNLLEDTAPQLVLCDVSMPRMDGLAFLRRLRADARFAALPVVIISATTDREKVLELASLQITDYLLKPFELVKTFQRFERMLLPMIEAETAAKKAEKAEQAAEARADAGAAHPQAPEPAPVEIENADAAETPG
jgi:two-component system, chemotaxis family, chemotaxis protein CheY